MKTIPMFRLVPEPVNEEAKNLPGFDPEEKEFGRRHQLGGSPQNIQKISWPKCSMCRKEMVFYGQLDSINPDLCLADAGVVQVFVCFDCFQAEARIDSY